MRYRKILLIYNNPGRLLQYKNTNLYYLEPILNNMQALESIRGGCYSGVIFDTFEGVTQDMLSFINSYIRPDP